MVELELKEGSRKSRMLAEEVMIGIGRDELMIDSGSEAEQPIAIDCWKWLERGSVVLNDLYAVDSLEIVAVR